MQADRAFDTRGKDPGLKRVHERRVGDALGSLEDVGGVGKVRGVIRCFGRSGEETKAGWGEVGKGGRKSPNECGEIVGAGEEHVFSTPGCPAACLDGAVVLIPWRGGAG